MTPQNISLIGSAFGLGAKTHSTSKGPLYLCQDYALHKKLGDRCVWKDMVQRSFKENFDDKGCNFDAVLHHNKVLAQSVQSALLQNDDFVTVLGGDHSCAMGTWSGVVEALHARENFGLIWIDAHMDAHTLESSPSKAYHGMPLSHLLGEGNPELCTILGPSPKIKPAHLVLIGIRSFEEAEKAFLKKHNVTVFYMEDVMRFGLDNVIAKALERVTKNTKGFGISIDVDAFDPSDAPGTGTPAPGGILFDKFKHVMPSLLGHSALKCLEITEFNPDLDVDHRTADLIMYILMGLTKARY
ncbi:MAG: arginase [Alphaproteobacteria bacterium]|nr:arginase [Alphaproteobacteria bacterium]